MKESPDQLQQRTFLPVLEKWQAVDLPNLQLSLDEQAIIIAEQREDSTASRRALADTTRTFKRMAVIKDAHEGSAIKTHVPSILKAYQTEVDKLTQRAKFSENCFLMTYRMIRELPDPSAAITQLLETLASSSEQAQEQISQNEAIKNIQVDDLDFVEAAASEQQHILERQLDELSEELTTIQTSLDNALEENERQAEHITELEAFQVQTQVHSSSPSISTSSQNVDELEQATSSLQEKLAVANARVKSLESTLNDERRQHTFELENIQERLNQQTDKCGSLKKELAARPTRDEHSQIKTQLRAMKRTMFNVDEREEVTGKTADDTELMRSTNEEGCENGEEDPDLDSLDTWLLANNRQLKEQLVHEQRRVQTQSDEIKKLTQAQEKLHEALADQTTLATKLEQDVTRTTTSDIADNRVVLDIEPVMKASSTKMVGNAEGGDGVSARDKASQSLLEVVCAQRDRFRALVDERDGRLDEADKAHNQTKVKLRALEEDNLQLYQRVRFLQSYKVSERSTLLSEVAKVDSGVGLENEEKGAPLLTNSHKGLGRGVEHKYRRIYEAPSNPLQAFQAQEAARMLPKGKVERWTVKAANAFLTRQRGRVFLFWYALSLHVWAIWCVTS